MDAPVELLGRQARHKAAALKKVREDPSTSEIYYVDEQTGAIWIMDFPNPEAGADARLRKIEDIPYTPTPASAQQG